MTRQAIGYRIHLLIAILVLSLGLGGVALAQRSSGSPQVNVTILDGTIKVSPTTFAPGKLTLIAVNMGSQSHALAIMGTGLQPKRTPTLSTGKTAQLTVTLKVGMYHVWDPVRSSMSHATMLMVKAAKAATTSSSTSSTGSKSSGGTSSGGTSSGGTSSGGTSSGGPSPGGTSPGGGGMPGMDPNDPCAGM